MRKLKKFPLVVFSLFAIFASTQGIMPKCHAQPVVSVEDGLADWLTEVRAAIAGAYEVNPENVHPEIRKVIESQFPHHISVPELQREFRDALLSWLRFKLSFSRGGVVDIMYSKTIGGSVVEGRFETEPLANAYRVTPVNAHKSGRLDYVLVDGSSLRFPPQPSPQSEGVLSYNALVSGFLDREEFARREEWLRLRRGFLAIEKRLEQHKEEGGTVTVTLRPSIALTSEVLALFDQVVELLGNGI